MKEDLKSKCDPIHGKFQLGISKSKIQRDKLKRLLGYVKTDLEPQLLNDILLDSKKRIDFFKDLNYFNKFSDVIDSIYPTKYANSLKTYLNRSTVKGLTESEADILYKIIELPLCTEFSFSPYKVRSKIEELVVDNESLFEVCEIVVGHFCDTMELAKRKDYKITLKELSQNNRFGFQSILLISEPGCGKSWIGQTIAEVLKIPCLTIDCSSNDYLGVSGSASNWSNSKEGIISRKLIEEGRFPFIVIFDEVDKAGHSNENYLIDTINHLIDPSKIFVDPYLNVPLYHLKSFIFILTANDESKIPSYIKSRAHKIYVKPSNPEVIVDGVIRAFVREFDRLNNSIKEIFKGSDKIKELLIEIFKKQKSDFRSLKGFLKVLYKQYKSPWNYNKDIKSFFIEKINKEINKSNRYEKPEIGFMRG